jgi:hypothetical protein
VNSNGLLDIDLLEAYLDGKLDAKGMHQVEKLSLEDPFVAEALAGLSESSSRSESLSILQKQLHLRIAQKPIEKKRWTITAQRLSIGSAAAVLFITVSVLFWMKENSRRQMESNAAKNVKIEIAPTDNQVAPQASPTAEKDAIIDKAIEAAKTNTYAGTSKPKVVTPAPVFAPLSKTTAIEDAAGPGAPSNMDAIKEISAERNLKKEIGQSEQAVLNEVRVTDVAKKSSLAARALLNAVQNAEPVIGWAKFEAYLLENNKLIKNKQLTGRTVQLSFVLQQNNRPTAIKIVSGLTKEENEEAIRLLTNGPDWKYNANSAEALYNVTIKF